MSAVRAVVTFESTMAVQAFVAPLQLALDCVTNAVLDVSGGYHVTDQPHALALRGATPPA